MYFKGAAQEHLSLSELDKSNANLIKTPLESGLSLLWFTADGNKLIIDGVPYTFDENQVLCLTEFHKLEIVHISKVKFVRFNRPFYCILDHDPQVGCRGVLFFGAAELPVFNIPVNELEKFDILWRMFMMEFQSRDNLQIEMLQMMLKRLLILGTRIYKEQSRTTNVDIESTDLIREFNYLVDVHFRTKHTVAEYATLLHKSPKTLSNYFSNNYNKSPIKIIQDRIIMEARRLLLYSEKPIKEIAYEIGFESIQSFSRFFKGKEGISPSKYKVINEKGSIDNFQGNID